MRQTEFVNLRIGEKPTGWSTKLLFEFSPSGPQSAQITGDLILARAQLAVCAMSAEEITVSDFLFSFNTLADARARVEREPNPACTCHHSEHENRGLYAHEIGHCHNDAKTTAAFSGRIEHLCGPCLEFCRNVSEEN